MSNGDMQGRIGQLLKIRPGTMNSVLVNTKPNVTISTSDSTVAIAQKINSMVTLDTYGTLIGVVAAYEPSNVGMGDDGTIFPNTAGNRGVAYVYIDVLHSNYSNLLNESNYKNFLTAVEILKNIELVPGAKVAISFKSTDYSQGTLVKVIDDNGFSNPLNKRVNIPASLKPCVNVKQPAPRSTPSNVTDKNPGYYQALYELAKWQIKYSNIKITNITFPFNADDDTRVSGKIEQVLEKVVQMNSKFLKDLEQNSNPQKQWVALVAQFTQDATYESSEDPRMIIAVDASEDIAPAVDDLNNFSRSYKATKRDDTSFFLSFPKSEIQLGVTGALALTAQNLSNFKNSFEKIIYDEVTTPPLQRTAPSVQSTNCGASGNTYPRTQVPNEEWQATLQLTKNFKVSDFDKDAVAPLGSSLLSGEEIQLNIINLAEQLEVIRDRLGVGDQAIRITLNGGYQPPLNARGSWWKQRSGFYSELPENAGRKDPGRSKSSQHRRGTAADIQVKGKTTSEVWQVIKELMLAGTIINGGLGYYPGFIHYDIRSKQKRWYKGGFPDQYSSLQEAIKAGVKRGL